MPFDVTSGLNMAEERISKLEDMMLKLPKEKEKKKKRLKKTEHSIQK